MFQVPLFLGSSKHSVSIIQLILEIASERGGDRSVMCRLWLGNYSPERLSDLPKVPQSEELSPVQGAMDPGPHKKHLLCSCGFKWQVKRPSFHTSARNFRLSSQVTVSPGTQRSSALAVCPPWTAEPPPPWGRVACGLCSESSEVISRSS